MTSCKRQKLFSVDILKWNYSCKQKKVSFLSRQKDPLVLFVKIFINKQQFDSTVSEVNKVSSHDQAYSLPLPIRTATTRP